MAVVERSATAWSYRWLGHSRRRRGKPAGRGPARLGVGGLAPGRFPGPL